MNDLISNKESLKGKAKETQDDCDENRILDLPKINYPDNLNLKGKLMLP